MKNTNNKELARLLEGLDRNHVRHLYKRASLIRKAKTVTVRPVEDGEDGPIVVRTRKSESLDDLVLRMLQEEQPEPPPETTEVETGLVLQVAKGRCTIATARGDRVCDLDPAIARAQQGRIAVGDEVRIARVSGEDRWIVETVGPRRTSLSRPDPHNPNLELVVVANVDAVAIVVSIKAPPLHPRIIDRYWIAIQKGGAEPILVVNKIDLLDGAELEEQLAKLFPYVRAGLPIVHCSADTGEGIAELRSCISGKLTALVGHSGVGKSSVLNALRPELNLRTGVVMKGYGRGAHTTTASSLHDLGGGTRVIDTPGIRSFGLAAMDARDLQWYFPEFAPWLDECRFRDCTHSHEPGCGVLGGVERGRISPERYETYRRLLES